LNVQGEANQKEARKIDWRFLGVVLTIILSCVTVSLVIGYTLFTGDDTFAKFAAALAGKFVSSK
jgi:hypothetical protein